MKPVNLSDRRIVVCADDFGMNPSIDAGIIDLARRGRLSGTSLLVDGPALKDDLPALQSTAAQLGLHLNLTESFGQIGLCLPLKRLIQAAYLRRLPAQAVQQAVDRQLARFRELTGQWPDYIDGHQHVHQLPGIREILLQTLGRIPDARPWVRSTARPRNSGLPWAMRLKAGVIAGLGARPLAQALSSAGYWHNGGFLGVYDFTGGESAYARWMACWLAQAQDNDVLMCHPAKGHDAQDTLSVQRQAEYAVLGSKDYLRQLAMHHLVLAHPPASKEPS